MGRVTQRPDFQILFLTCSFGEFIEETSIEKCLKNIETAAAGRNLIFQFWLAFFPNSYTGKAALEID